MSKYYTELGGRLRGVAACLVCGRTGAVYRHVDGLPPRPYLKAIMLYREPPTRAGVALFAGGPRSWRPA